MRKIIGVAATAAILVLAGCAQASAGTTSSTSSKPAAVKSDDGTLEEKKITLSNGRVVTCVAFSDYDYFNKTKASGLSCDWYTGDE